ncbi:hypothetical protein CLU99_3288 [Flavobacterium sp. 2]|nr:hypothetical protein CLU99_3288 [Flavobacterium sp. 2]
MSIYQNISNKERKEKYEEGFKKVKDVRTHP